MFALDQARHFWHRLMGPDLPAQHTAIAFHWPACGVEACRADQTFILSGILRGEELHRVLDPLIEEHVSRDYGSDGAVVTEVTIFWHLSDGSWEMDELESRLYA